jgi:glycerol-3-phosphate acyltransferase PlsY
MTAAAILVAYLVGSLSFAVIVSRAFGLPDPHTYGSGNPGATNVLRTGRKAAAVLTLLGDALKGFVVVLAVRLWWHPEPVGDAGLAAVAVAAFSGHLYPVWFRFKGGKGVATAAGILFALSGWLGLCASGAWALAFAVTRISSLGALAAAVAAPLAGGWLLGWNVLTLGVAAMGVMIFWRHRENIRRLMDGSEKPVAGKS